MIALCCHPTLFEGSPHVALPIPWEDCLSSGLEFSVPPRSTQNTLTVHGCPVRPHPAWHPALPTPPQWDSTLDGPLIPCRAGWHFPFPQQGTGCRQTLRLTPGVPRCQQLKPPGAGTPSTRAFSTPPHGSDLLYRKTLGARRKGPPKQLADGGACKTREPRTTLHEPPGAGV